MEMSERDNEDIQNRLAGLSIEQRLAGLAPELVLATYTAEQLLIALPDKALRSLSHDYLATLSTPTRTAICARIGSELLEDDVDIRKLEGYDEVVQMVQSMTEGLSEELEARKQQIRVLISRLPPDHALAGFSPEQVLAAYRFDPASVNITPEQVLAGLPPEQALAIFTPEQLLCGLTPEQVLAGLTPEQRLAGLTPEQTLLALPDEVLRTFPDEYLATLSEPTRTAIGARIGR